MATRNANLTRRGSDLIRFDPWSEIQDMRRTMDDLFNRYVGFSPARLFSDAAPSWSRESGVDLYETQDEVIFTAELPGFDREDVELQVTGDTLQLSARHRAEESPATDASKETTETPGAETTDKLAQFVEPSRIYHIQGRRQRSLSMSYALPAEIDPDRVQATFKNGVLEVRMAKPERSKPKQVKVNIES